MPFEFAKSETRRALPFWNVLKGLMSRFINKNHCVNKSLILDRELSFLPIYSKFIEQVSLKDPSVRDVLWRLPRRLKALCDVMVKQGYLRYVGVLMNIIKPIKGMKVLDVGCQFGTNLLELTNWGVDIYGVDLMFSYISVLKKRCECLDIEVHAVVADGAMLPFRDGCFDVVMSREFVSHVADLYRALGEMFRVTSEKVIVEDTNMINPIGFLTLFVQGGLKWLFTKGKVHKYEYHGR